MKILSLFDGISCARVALERAGIPVDIYIASEIDKYAIEISKKNWPDIIHRGDVRQIQIANADQDDACVPVSWTAGIEKIDLLIGGSPCQDLSIAKKNRKGLEGDRSGLFWEYVRILKEVKPKYFILENVANMSKEAEYLITKTLEVKPILIDASLVSGTERKRLFWTNIPNITLPEDKNLMTKDFIDENAPRKWIALKNVKKTKRGIAWDISGKGYCSQQDRAYSINGKFSTIPTSRTITKVNVLFDDGAVGVMNWDEIESIQGLPKGYTDLGENNRIEKRGAVLGNLFHPDIIAHILSFIPKQ